jgi:excisionase family DNA binding protein
VSEEGSQDMLTVKQAAARIGISPSLVYALCHDGVIRHTRHGRPGRRGCIRIEESAIEEYRETCRKQGRPDAAPLVLKHITLR